MADLLFQIIAVFTLGTALGVVVNKNAVASALCLMLCLVGVAGIFVLLDAFLLAVLMVFVYAGAVVALFLFIVMLLDSHGTRKAYKKTTIAASIGATALLVLGLTSFAKRGHVEAPVIAENTVAVGATLRNYGEQLFTTYLLPVQIVGFLLLIAMLGVIVLSKRFEGLEDVK